MGKRNRKSAVLRTSFIEALESRVLLNSAISPTYNPVEGEGWDVGTLDGSGNLYVPSNANVSAYQVRENSITVDPYGTLQIDGASAGAFDPSHVSIVNGLSIAQTNGQFTGTLNLNNTVLIIRAQPGETNAQAVLMLNYVSSALQSGFNEGLWNGMGITSSAAAYDAIYGSGDTALGVLLNDDGTGTNTPIYTSLLNDGSIPLYDNDIVIADTLYGDADLNGTVNLDDFSDWLAGFQDPSVDPVWQNGNFLYENSVSLDDFTMWQSYEGLSIPVSTVPQGGIYNPNYLASFPAPSDATSDTPYVTWGDGSSSEPAAFVLENGQMNVLDTHVYSSPGVYSGWVYLTDSSGNQSGTFTMNVGAPPATNLTATYVSPTETDLSWTNNTTGATVSLLGRGGSDNSWGIVNGSTGTEDAFTDPGPFLANTAYSFEISTTYNDATSFSDIVTVQTAQTPEAVSLSATAVSPFQVNLSWTYPTQGQSLYGSPDPETDPDSFVIERQVYPDGTWQTIGTASGTANGYEDTSVADGTQYGYQVFATSGNQNGAVSRTYATTPYAGPSGFTATEVSSSEIDLSWTNNTQTTGTQLEINEGTSENYWQSTVYVSGTTDGYAWMGTFDPTQTYYFQVGIYNTSGYYNVDEGLTSCSTNPAAMPPPPRPMAVYTTVISDSEIDIYWQSADTDNSAAYLVQRSDDGGTTWVPLATVDDGSTDYYDTTVSPDSTYTYEVSAANDAGTSTFTPSGSAVTPPAAPGSLTATGASISEIDLSWTAPDGNDSGYLIQESTDGQDWSTIDNVDSSTTLSYQDFGTYSYTQPYYFRIASENAYHTLGSDYTYSNMVDFASLEPANTVASYPVPGGGGTIVTQPLAQGVDYQIQASGALEMGYAYGDNQEGDAGYVDFDSGQTVSGDPENNDFPYGIFINGKNPGWGQYNPSHVYTVNYVGNGKPLDLYYSDDYYPDNYGAILVTITGPNTSVTVSDAANPSNEALSMILGQFAPQTLYVPETSAGNAVVTLDGDLGAGADWSVDGSTASPSSGTASGPTNITLTPTSGNDDYTLDVTANDQAWTLDIDVIPWEIDAQTMENGQPQGLLPLNQRMSPGAFVPVDDGDSNYDGWLDDQEPNNGPPPANDDRLLQVTLNGIGDLNPGDHYTVLHASNYVRVFYQPSGGGPLLPVTSATPLSCNTNTTLYVEGTQSGFAELDVNWTTNGTSYSDVDQLQVAVFEMTGPLDTPGNGSYSYFAQVQINSGPGTGGTWSPLLPAGAAWIDPSGGTLVSAISPNNVVIQWNNPAAGEIGKGKFEVDSSYTWDFDVNVDGISVAAAANSPSMITYNNPATQPSTLSSSIDSTPRRGLDSIGVTPWITINGPPGPGGKIRGTQFLELGYVQNGQVTKDNAVFADGSTMKSALQNASWMVDSDLTNGNWAPWSSRPLALATDLTAPKTIKNLTFSDRPGNWGLTPSNLLGSPNTGSPLTGLNIVLSFTVWLIAATDETVSGSRVVQMGNMPGNNTPSASQAEYAPIEEADWASDMTGTFATVPGTPGEVFTPSALGGNSGDTALGPPTSPPVTVFTQVMNQITNNEDTWS